MIRNEFIIETDLMHSVMIEVSKMGHIIFRNNVGKVRTESGGWFDTGLPKGYADLSGILKGGTALFIETKQHPKKPTKEQCNFLLRMIKQGAHAGVAYTVQEAKDIVEWKPEFARSMEKKLRSLYVS